MCLGGAVKHALTAPLKNPLNPIPFGPTMPKALDPLGITRTDITKSRSDPANSRTFSKSTGLFLPEN